MILLRAKRLMMRRERSKRASLRTSALAREAAEEAVISIMGDMLTVAEVERDSIAVGTIIRAAQSPCTRQAYPSISSNQVVSTLILTPLSPRCREDSISKVFHPKIISVSSRNSLR
jgi:hypothetical protein